MVTNFDSIIDKLPDVIYTANTVNNHSRRVNNAVFSLYGYTQQEWACQPDMWHACLHTDDRQRVLQVISAIKENSEGYVQYRIIRKDGSVRWLADHYNALASVEGNGLCVYGVMTDITEYKNQIEYSRQNLDELLEESATVIYRCEPSGNFPATFISNNVTRQMGYMPEDFITDSSFWMNHIHPDERDHVLGDLSKLFEHGYHSHEYRFLHANGTYVWMHDELRLSYDDNGKLTDIIGNWIDISKTKQLEHERAQHEQSIQQAKKMQAIGTLAGGVAHEFNNMLGVIMGYTELILKLEDLPDRGREFSSQILTAANRSKEVVQQLLSLSHKNDRNLELVNVNRQIEDEIAFLRSYIPSSIQLEVEILVEDTYIMIDLGEFRQILINLVSNAVHAMSNKGLLSITIDRLEIDHVPDKTDVNLAAGHYLRLTVKDTGRGISDEVMPHLFEPFYTTKDVGEGTGMGLALVYSMLEAYGGYAGVKSEPGDGAVFELYFPVIDEPLTLAAAEVTESQTRGEANTCCRVLFVDDEKLFAELGKALLTDLGYKVDISTSSKDALTRFSSCPDAYDLLITDQMMPDLLGTELSEAVLKIRPDMKIVLCTGFGVGIDRELALLKGINGYITKPFRQDQFRVEIEKVIDS